MRLPLILSAALIPMPAAAQDHAHHQMGTSDKEGIDHCAMGHLPPEQCPPKQDQPAHDGMDHSAHQSANPPTHEGMDHSQHQAIDHSQHAMPMDKSVPGAAPEAAVPERALDGPRHAADAIWGASAMDKARESNRAAHGLMTTGMVMVERLEARLGGGEDGYLWDARAFYGGDISRFVLKSEGEGEYSGSIEDAEVQALYSRAITPFFDLQAGVRLDVEPETRSHAVIGIEGLAPYMLHVDAGLFLSDRGDLTARIEAEYDQKITQQLILQPRIEAEAAAQDIPEGEIGAGLTKIELGTRLRYELVPEFAPYVGVDYEAKLGETADIARAKGEDTAGFKVLIGLRAWF